MKFKLLSVEDVREHAGYVYNEGPPHDRNYDWVDSRFVEQLHPDVLNESEGKIRVLVDENGKPLEFQGKWILDSYQLLPKRSQVGYGF